MLASLLRIILLTATLKILERGLDKGPIIELQDRRRKANKERQVNEYAVNEHKAVMMRRDAIPKEVEHTSSHYDAAGVLKAKKAKKKKKVQMAAQQVATVEEVSLF